MTRAFTDRFVTGLPATLTALALGLYVVGPCFAAGDPPINLLTNSSFEIEADGAPEPDGWTGPVAVFTVVDKAAWDGGVALQCRAPGRHASIWQAVRGLAPGTELALEARVKRPDGEPVTGISILATDPTWNWSAEAVRIGDDEGWEVRSVHFTMPPKEMDFLRVRIHAYPEAEGDILVDGLMLCEGVPAGGYLTREGARVAEKAACASVVKAVEGGVFIDFGPQSQPLMPGFSAVGADALFDTDRGHGWLPGATLAAVLRTVKNGVVPRPDSLCGDFVRISGQATYRLRVPAGDYRLLVWMGDIDRYSFEDHDYTLSVNGSEVASEHLSREDFLQEHYLAGALREMNPATETVFDHCIAPRFPVREVEVQIDTGELDVQFSAGGSICLDGLAVVPAAAGEAGERALEEVDRLRRMLFADAHPATVEAPLARPEGFLWAAGDMTIWARPFWADPDERIADVGLRLSACPGEEETISLVFMAAQHLLPEDTPRDVDVTIGPLMGADGSRIPAEACRAEWLLVRPVPTSHTLFDTNRCTVRGDVLSPRPMPVLEPSRPRQCWLTVSVPDDARPGMYRGAVSISAGGRVVRELSLRLRVREFSLAPLDYACGAYYYPPGYLQQTLGGMDGTHPRVLALLEQELRVARRIGFNMVSRFPWPPITEVVDGRPVLDYTFTDTYMDAVQRAGLSGAIPGYQGMTHMLAGQLGRYAPEGSEEFTRLLRLVIADVRDHGRQRGWPEVMVYIGDEFTPAEAEERIAGLCKAAHGVEGVRTICNGYWNAIPIVAPWLDIALAPTPPPAEAAEKLKGTPCTPALYNCGLDRFSMGFYTAANPGPVRLEWHFQYLIGDPHNYIDTVTATEFHSMVLPGPERSFWRTCAFELREGIDDYRYWLTLRQMVSAAERAGRPVPEEAVQVLADVDAAGTPGENMYPARPLSAADCQRLRERIVHAIEQMGEK